MSLKAIILYGLLYCIYSNDATQVTVSEGILQGSEEQTVALNVSYYSFKGIPYAKPPVGDLRFMPTQAPESWSGVRNATDHGYNCPQYDIFQQKYINGSEDCLTLNVYTPCLDTSCNLSVVFFIHGGGYESGSGDSGNYGPDFFIEKDVVVVTINYRLDALGFLCLENEVVPGNMGMKDQVAALKWVNKNIENFGGNPSNITIMGQSAGGASVALHLISPMSKGLFQRAISMSGTPNAEFSITYKPSYRAFKLGSLLGLDTTNATELLIFLQSVPAMSLINANTAILGSEAVGADNILKYFNFIPVIEKDFGTEQFLTVDPLEAFINGDIHDVDIMFGVTSEEAVTGIPYFVNSIINTTANYPEMLVPKKILYNSTPDTALEIANLTKQYYFDNVSISIANMKEFVHFASETYLTVPINRMFSHLPASDSFCRYSYVFSSFSDRNYYGKQGVPYGIYAPGHLDDLLYLFQASALNLTIDINSEVYEYVNLTSTVFSNFIKYGNPTPDSSLDITWPEYNSTNKCYVNIANSTLVIGNNYINSSISFVEKIFSIAGIEF